MKAELIDFMGSDLTVVNAARVSFDKESGWVQRPYKDEDTLELEDEELPAEYDEWDGYPEAFDNKGRELSPPMLSEKDHKLIKYLAKHNHWTPFSHPQITMRETVPIFVARQRFKHTVGFTYNEVSRRYVDNPPEFYVPDAWRWRPEGSVKQGSGEILDQDSHDIVSGQYTEALIACENAYDIMIELGVAPEQARMILPQSMYTSYYVTGSLAAWARAYKQRIDNHAQKEIQDLAKQWGGIISREFPESWSVLTR